MTSIDEDNAIGSGSSYGASEEETVDESPNKNSKKRKAKSEDTALKKVHDNSISEKPSVAKRRKKSKEKPPTVEELNELRETENLYNNNLFRFQIEELVKEVKIKNQHENAFRNWMGQFKKFIKDLPENEQFIASGRSKKKSKISLGPNINCDQESFVLNFLKPVTLEHYGLHRLRANPGPILVGYLNLKIPKEFFHIKDYLNNRYFVKRYSYLKFIKKRLEKTGICSQINWNYYKESLLPILEVVPKGSEKVVIKLLATPLDYVFKKTRFAPDLNNIKANIYNLVSFEDNEELKNIPTPFYNSLLAHDFALSTNNSFIETSLKELNNIKEALKLLQIWLTQRQLNKTCGSFTEDLLLLFVIYLLEKKRINKHMSSYQVIRNVWNFIHEHDLIENPLSLCEEVTQETLSGFKKAFDVVFLDKTGFYNAAAFLNIDIYRKLKSESQIALKLLDSGGLSAFHSLFISKITVELQYEVILRLEPSNNYQNLMKLVEPKDKVQFLSHESALVIKRISEVLKKGLNKRSILIVPYFKINPSINSVDEIIFGINLDLDQAFRFIEIGPALNDPQEWEFREFWGSMSSDRRFKDGSICVAVHFETETIQDRRGIIKRILDFIVTDKLKLEYNLYYNEFEHLLTLKNVEAGFKLGTNEELTLKLITASDELNKILRNLELPLTITGTSTISNSLSFTDVFPPIPTIPPQDWKKELTVDKCLMLPENIKSCPRYFQPIEFILQLAHNSKWPHELEEIRNMKTAFYLEVTKVLTKKYNLVTSIRPESFDVYYEGFVFRYCIHLPREISLVKKQINDEGLVVYRDSPESRQLEMNLNYLPKIMGALKGIQSQYPSFGPGTALIKRWLRSHLIDDYLFPDVVINLLNASLFINCSPYLPPCTPQIVFFRFLKFISELEPQVEPVIVNFNDEISKEQLVEIDSKMLQSRGQYPDLFLATPYDNCESIFTQKSPTKPVLRRVKQMATETLSFINNCITEGVPIRTKELFIPNLDGYNILIHLKPLFNPLRAQNINRKEEDKKITFDVYDPEKSKMMPIVDFNPAQLYLTELRVLVEHDYIAKDSNELSITKGDIIKDVVKMQSGWFEGTLKDNKGLFPDNYVKILDKDSAASSVNVIMRNRKDATRIWQCRVVYSYKQDHEDELNLNIGDIIDIIGEEEEGWWRGVLNGREGVFPSNFVEEITATTTTKSKSGGRESLSGVGDLNLGPSPALPSKPPKTVCQVRFPYKAQNDDELTLREGDLVTLLSKDGQDPGWWRGELNGVVGVFPDNFVIVVPINASTTSTATVTLEDRLKDERKPRPHTDILNLNATLVAVISQNRKSLESGQIGGTKPDLEPVKTTPPVPGKKPVVPIKKSPSSGGGSGGLFFGLKKKIVDVVDGATGSKAAVSPPKVETNNNNNNNNSENAFDDVTRRPLLSDPRATRPKAPGRRLPTGVGKDSEPGVMNGNSDHLNGPAAPTASPDSDATDNKRKMREWEKHKAPWLEEMKQNQAKRKSTSPGPEHKLRLTPTTERTETTTTTVTTTTTTTTDDVKTPPPRPERDSSPTGSRTKTPPNELDRTPLLRHKPNVPMPARPQTIHNISTSLNDTTTTTTSVHLQKPMAPVHPKVSPLNKTPSPSVAKSDIKSDNNSVLDGLLDRLGRLEEMIKKQGAVIDELKGKLQIETEMRMELQARFENYVAEGAAIQQL